MVLSKSLFCDDVMGGEERREERRMISSSSSVGRVACVLVWDWLWRAEFEDVVAEVREEVRSRFRRADLSSCDLELRTRDDFRACLYIST